MFEFAADFTLRDALEITNAVVSIFLAIEFIIYTYSDKHREFLRYPEMFVLLYLTFDFVLFLYIDHYRIIYPFLPQSFVSYITIIPSFLLFYFVIRKQISVHGRGHIWKNNFN